MFSDSDKSRLFIQAVTSGGSGCRAYRVTFPSLVFNWTDGSNVSVIETPVPLLDHDILCNTKTILIKSPWGKGGLELVKNLCAVRMKYGIRLVADWDDQCLSLDGQLGVSFNQLTSDKVPERDDPYIEEMIPLFDAVMVTTEFFAEHLRNRTGADNIHVVPNSVPRYLWSKPRRTPIERGIEKPTILLSRSPLHNASPTMSADGERVKGDPGDWASGQFAEWIIHGLENGRFNVIQVGEPNWMLEPVWGRMSQYPWVSPLRFPSFISRLDADITLAPIVDQPFNRFKSDLALIEASVCSQVPLASRIKDGPYNSWLPECLLDQGVTEQELNERLELITTPDMFNRIIDWQWEKLYMDGRITESDSCMNRYCMALLGGPRNAVSFDLQ